MSSAAFLIGPLIYQGNLLNLIFIIIFFRSSTTLSSQAPTEASDDALEDHINVVLR